jgi:hypothetical protein
MVDTLKKNALIGLFALSGFAATAQTAPATPAKPDEKLSALKNTEFLFLLKSYHLNKQYDYNEFNFPSLIVKQHLTPNVSAIAGVYRNSNYTFSPMGGGMIETNPINLLPDGKLRMRAGLTAGFALYNKEFRHDTTYISATTPMPADGKIPKNKKLHGREVMYYRTQNYDSLCDCTRDEITEVTRRIAPRGVGPKKPRFALFPSVSLDVFRDNGLWFMGAYGPGLGPDNRWGGVLAGGLRLSPYHLAND